MDHPNNHAVGLHGYLTCTFIYIYIYIYIFFSNKRVLNYYQYNSPDDLPDGKVVFLWQRQLGKETHRQ